MSIDKYFGRRFNATKYNCAHFVCEVWTDLRGPEISDILRGFLCGPSERVVDMSALRAFRFLKRPESLCVVYMPARIHVPHVGVWIDGKVLHLTARQGVQYQPLDVASAGHKRVRYLTC